MHSHPIKENFMKRALIASVALAASLIATAPLSAQTKAEMAKKMMAKDMVAATVDGQPIMDSDIQAFYNNLPPQYRQTPLLQIRAQLLERMVDQTMVANAARKEGLLDRADVQKRIKSITTRVLNEIYISEKLKAAVTDAKVKDEYQKSIALEKKSEEVKARHILVKTKAEAMAVIKELQGGADFMKVAKAKSTGPSGRNGGDLGYFGFKQMVPPFSKAAFALKPGEITTEPVKTQFGWHVIKVEDRRVAGAANFEQASQKIRQEFNQKAYKETIAQLRSKSKVEMLGAGISKIQPLR
jgi:peptidyl-prolyl cis-trans isomerase C